MKKLLKRLTCALLCCMLTLAPAALADADEEVLSVTTNVREISKYGHAVLDMTIDDFNALGFELGDVIHVSAGTYAGDMPYLNGYYVERGEHQVIAYPSNTYVGIAINYGNFSEEAGVQAGDTVTLTLSEKGGALLLQQANDLTYENIREAYTTDEEYANFRPVVVGDIAPGRLYRSASPVNNENNRAAWSNRLAEAAGIKTVMNVADSDEEIAGYFAADDFDSEYYKALYEAGQVIPLDQPIDFESYDFGAGVARGLTFLSEHNTPYLVHCTEGKDRAGFASMTIEMLMNASVDEIIDDYMQSYVNYYHTSPEDELYYVLVERNILPMMRLVAGVQTDAELYEIDLPTATEGYLIEHGMTEDAIAALRSKLSDKPVEECLCRWRAKEE